MGRNGFPIKALFAFYMASLFASRVAPASGVGCVQIARPDVGIY